MNELYLFLDRLYTALGLETTYLAILYRIVGALAGSIIIWFILKRVLAYVERKIKNYEFIKIHENIFVILRRAFLYSLILIIGTYLMRILKIQFIENAFYALLIILLASPVKEFTIIALQYFEQNVGRKTETRVDDILFDLLNKFAGAIIYATAIILALDILGVNVMPFIAGAGVAGVAIGFAAKDTLSNLIAGVLLIIDRPFETGDRIEVWTAPSGSATWGDVIEIGLRATKIKTTDNIIIIIPNNEIMKRDIINYTILSAKIRVRINVGVSYDSDIEKAKKVIIKIADTADWILKNPAPKVVVRNFGESSVDLQLRVWIDEARKRIDTISYVTDHVKEAFDKEGIEIPYPKRDITLIQKAE